MSKELRNNSVNNVDERILTEDELSSISGGVEPVSALVCPKCGGRLVERRGKYGSFYGCSNYPKCKFTTQ